MPETVEICAICEVTCALSIGFIGSWLLNWATSNLRKRSSDAAWLALDAVVVLAVVVPEVTADAVVMAMVASSGKFY